MATLHGYGSKFILHRNCMFLWAQLICYGSSRGLSCSFPWVDAWSVFWPLNPFSSLAWHFPVRLFPLCSVLFELVQPISFHRGTKSALKSWKFWHRNISPKSSLLNPGLYCYLHSWKSNSVSPDLDCPSKEEECDSQYDPTVRKSKVR